MLNSRYAIADDGGVDLYPDGVFGVAPELFYPEMLFYPFEEQLDLPL